MQKSPTTAILYSLLLPGLGQIYVEQYWKAPLFVGGVGALGYFIIYFHNHFNDEIQEIDNINMRISELEITDPTNPEISYLKNQKLPLHKSRREFYRDNRDQSAFFLLGVYIIAAVDAYVGAHLFDFNVDDDISLKFSPIIMNNFSAGVRLSIRW